MQIVNFCSLTFSGKESDNLKSSSSELSSSDRAANTSSSLSFSDSEVKLNDYVLVKITSKKIKKYFVALIVEREEDQHTFFVKFMKKTAGSTLKFIFPVIEDLGIIKTEDIVLRLPQPEILRRGEFYTFTSKLLNKYLID